MNDIELTIIKNLWFECTSNMNLIDFIIDNKLGDKMTVEDVARIIENMCLQAKLECHCPVTYVLRTLLSFGRSKTAVSKYIERHPSIIHMTINQVKRLNIK